MAKAKYYTYTTKEGDTFDLLALRYYDEEKLANYIISANPYYADVVVFESGVKLTIPIIDEPETTETKAPWRR